MIMPEGLEAGTGAVLAHNWLCTAQPLNGSTVATTTEQATQPEDSTTQAHELAVRVVTHGKAHWAEQRLPDIPRRLDELCLSEP